MLENKEIWKDIKGYEGKYQVSNMGRVWSVRAQRCLSPDKSNGYCRVQLHAKNGKIKKELVHRLVALAFIPNPNNLTIVHHKDANTMNNTISNLAWVTAIQNNTDKHRMKLVQKQVLCVETNQHYNSIKEAAADKGICASHIGEVCKGKRKTCGGYHWCFVGGDAVGND